jgi:hypothetical protein
MVITTTQVQDCGTNTPVLRPVNSIFQNLPSDAAFQTQLVLLHILHQAQVNLKPFQNHLIMV